MQGPPAPSGTPYVISRNIRDHHFVFVCGLHRSGTSVLFRSLRDHPDISGFDNTGSFEDEGMHLQSVYLPSGAYGGAGAFGFHREAHLTENSPLVTAENQQKLFEEWSPYWDLTKKYLLEKSPPNLIRTRFLQAIFPESSFIVMMRHPLAVSYATRAWYRHYRINWRSLSRILEHWLVCHEIFMEDRKYLRNQPLVIKYEHFVAEPQRWVARVHEMLGLEPRPAQQKILSHVNAKYFNKWNNDRSGTFSKITARSIIRRYEERCRAFGYSLADPGYDSEVLGW